MSTSGIDWCAAFMREQTQAAANLARAEAAEALLRDICAEFAQQHPLIAKSRELLADHKTKADIEQ